MTGRRHEPLEGICAATAVGILLAAAAGEPAAGLFLVFTLVALLILRRLRLPSTLELCFSIGILLQGWGNALPLFEQVGWYDKAVHFLTPMLLVPSLYVLLVRAGALWPPWESGRLRRGTLGAVAVTVAIGTALATIWELLEGSADRLLGMSLAHGYWETIDDLYSSFFGSLAAGAVLAWWLARGAGGLAAESLASEALPESE